MVPKLSKSIDMRFHWIQDRIKQLHYNNNNSKRVIMYHAALIFHGQLIMYSVGMQYPVRVLVCTLRSKPTIVNST
jgi:hypothetical protein